MDKTLNLLEGFPIEPAWKPLCNVPYPIKDIQSSGSKFPGDVAHGSKWSNVMYKIAEKTGEVTTLGLTDCTFKIIGNLDIFGVEVVGAAWAAQRQLMYITAKSSLSTTINLYTIDLDTGRASFVMPLGNAEEQSSALAYDEDFDALYMFNTYWMKLMKIDVGLGTINTACGIDYSGAIDFDPCTGILYESASGLYALNKHTGEKVQLYSSMDSYVPIAVLDYPCSPHIHCSDAIDWDLSSVMAFTTYYGYTNISCFDINKRGAIFKYNATNNGKLTVTTCSASTTFDTMIYVFTDCNHNTSATCLGTNDDAPCSHGGTASTYKMEVEYNKCSHECSDRIVNDSINSGSTTFIHFVFPERHRQTRSAVRL
ncbi:hypothetical protein Pelo_18793 [Pelomyxa schiedti]|nr:hypothetical protein Pelo_18793 [Pelomyxa schiedti]